MSVEERLQRIEQMVATLLEKQTIKDWYGTEEAARIVGKAEFTVREWCRLGRILAEKRGSGRGKYQSWVISHAELQRIQREGLLPLRRPTRSSKTRQSRFHRRASERHCETRAQGYLVVLGID